MCTVPTNYAQCPQTIRMHVYAYTRVSIHICPQHPTALHNCPHCSPALPSTTLHSPPQPSRALHKHPFTTLHITRQHPTKAPECARCGLSDTRSTPRVGPNTDKALGPAPLRAPARRTIPPSARASGPCTQAPRAPPQSAQSSTTPASGTAPSPPHGQALLQRGRRGNAMQARPGGSADRRARQRGRRRRGIRSGINRTINDCGWSDVARPLEIAACTGRRIPWESYPDSAPTRRQAAAVIIWARADRHHSELLAITPATIEGRY